MEYTVNKLARISGVSTRTLRYYDQIGLLKPLRISSNGYRVYGQKEVDILQQILFYRELDVSLEEIGHILSDPHFDREKALANHLTALLRKKNQLETLIDNVQKTIGTLKGETIMSDKEKFEGFKQKLVRDNESAYGEEIRKKYGNDTVDASNAKLMGMSEARWQEAQDLSAQLSELLKEAFLQGDPASEKAQKACELHKQWLCMFWKDGAYSKDAHKGLAQMYVDDERFTAYYDAIAVGCTAFLRDAIHIYCE